MQDLELTWKRIASIWWLIIWRGLLVGGLLGAFVGGFTGAIAVGIAAHVFKVPLDAATYVQMRRISILFVCIPLWAAWGLFIIRMVLGKKYAVFRIALVSTEAATPSPN